MKVFLQFLLISAFTLGIAACGDYEPPEGEDFPEGGDFPAQQDQGGDFPAQPDDGGDRGDSNY